MEAKFNIVKKGYSSEEVDQYISKLEEVLESYKEKDISIKNAILSSQIAADNIVKNAELEAEKIIAKARNMLTDIAASISTQKQLLKEFQDDYNAIVGKYLQHFNEADMVKLHSKVYELEDYITKLQNGQ